MRCGRLCRWCVSFFFQAEDGIRDLVRSRGLGDVYKRQSKWIASAKTEETKAKRIVMSVNALSKQMGYPEMILSLIHI